MTRVVKVSVSVATLALLLWWADAEAVAERLRGADPMWLGVAWLSLTVSTFLMARRWQILTHALLIELPFKRALAEYYISQLVNAVLPGGVVGDVGRAIRIRHDGDLIRAAQSVAAERLIGQIAMFLFMAVGFACALLLPGGIAWPPITWLGLAALGVAALTATVFARRDTSTARFLRLVLGLMRNLHLILNAAVIVVLLIFSLYACARATDTIIPIGATFTLIPLVLSAMLIPLSVGGWGWREGAAAALFPLIGATPSAGIAMGIAYGTAITLAALPALVFLAVPSQANPLSKTVKLESP
ncbi:lysylphosphatidylglycerol synthase transmembrane domain-containing protein [uncultured Roseobacter sp.]|uniref:lysylphosphatidylglycerol synthase transmembrane domain-containing protein n=1 Tax=uncultured Roseobacter sp. TaxID=114847 RepID=UPI0026345519|nr:lysylphosphatidylglycerol synthase transmembrane domain-containing protein [uncultured Roseobacter sp.]